MRAKTLLVIPFLLLAGLAQAQSSLEDFCGSLVADSTIEVADDFTSEEIQAQLSVMAGLNLLQTDLDFAISMFNEALKVAEEYADAYLGRGCAYFLQGDNDSATADFEQFIQLTDDGDLAATVSGLISGETTEISPVGEECAMAIRTPAPFTPAEAQAFVDGFSETQAKTTNYMERAEAYLCLGEYDLAFDDFTTVIELQPGTADHYTARGIAYRRLGEYELAIADFSAALEIDPDSVDALDGRAYSSYLLGDYEQCITDYNRSIELFAEDFIAFSNRGLCYSSLDQFDAAIADYNLALELAPDDAITIGNRAVAYRLMGEYDLALEDNNQAIAIDPNDPFYFVERGLVYYEMGEYRSAVEDFLAALELDLTYADAWLNLGDAQRILKDTAAAVESYTRYLELYPDSPYAEELQEFIDGQQ
jgi:tetratricopeptide (TPR) repeat protein